MLRTVPLKFIIRIFKHGRNQIAVEPAQKFESEVGREKRAYQLPPTIVFQDGLLVEIDICTGSEDSTGGITECLGDFTVTKEF